MRGRSPHARRKKTDRLKGIKITEPTRFDEASTSAAVLRRMRHNVVLMDIPYVFGVKNTRGERCLIRDMHALRPGYAAESYNQAWQHVLLSFSF